MPANNDDHQAAIEEDAQEDMGRADSDEGIRASLASEGADHAEMSVFDGAGNESVVVVTDDDEGQVSQGTGGSSEEAMADAKKPGQPLGDAIMGK